jgi:CPA2 family monovalent cation:H+ antiporter-2
MSTPGHDDPLLSVLVLLAGGLASIALSTKTGLNFLLALIAFGVLLGPFGLDWASHAGAVELLAELGVAFLLFDIGLHLSAKSLWAARRYLFAFAPLQIGLCSVLLWTGLRLAPGLSDVGLWLAAALSLSSTAVVLQLFRDSGEEQTPIGRAALAALLAQDLFVILLLVLIPAIGSDSGLMSAALPALGRLGVALVLCIGGGRLILAPLLGSVARLDRPEAFTAAALFVVLSTAWLTLSFGLSIALGAFLAGVALAEGRYAPAVQAELAPFRGLLLSLFFLTVGMSIELPAVFANVIPVLLLTIGILVTKTLGTLFAARLVGKGWGSALRLGLSLSQGSEFALVVFAVAGQHALLSPVQRAPLAAAIVLSIGVTPLLAGLGKRVAARLESPAIAEPESISGGRVVLIGFDATMEALARGLDRAAVPFIAFSSDRDRTADARALGFDVHHGDPSRPRGLALAASGGASAIVVGVADEERSLALVRQSLELAPDIPVYAITGQLPALEAMQEAGAADVVLRNDEAAKSLAKRVLGDLGARPADVEEGIVECGERKSAMVGGCVTA